MSIDKTLQTKLIIFGIATIVIIYILKVIFKRVGLIKSDETLKKEAKVIELANSDYFNPNYHEGKNFKKLSDTEIKQAVLRLRRAMRGIGTGESQIYAVFKTLDSKLQISQLSKGFYNEYKKDLLTEIQDELREKEQAILMDIITELPNR